MVISKGYKSFQKSYPRAHRFLQGTSKAIVMAGKAYKIATHIAGIINSEKKYFDVSINAQPVSATPTVTHLSNITQGNTDITRVGDSIGVKSYQFRGLRVFANAALDSNRVRVLIVQDNDNNEGTPPTASNVLTVTNDTIGLRNMNYNKRFKVLYDKTWTNNNTLQSTPINWFKTVKMQKDRSGNPIKMKHITWNNNNTTTQRGHLYMICVTDCTDAPTIYGKFRIRYYDN